MDEKLTLLSRVLFTIDQIEVHGKKNMNMMLGTIQELERLKELLEQEKAVTADVNGN